MTTDSKLHLLFVLFSAPGDGQVVHVWTQRLAWPVQQRQQPRDLTSWQEHLFHLVLEKFEIFGRPATMKTMKLSPWYKRTVIERL